MRDIVVTVFMFIGAFFMFVAALGVLRMPDLFMRLSTTTKAATLGAMSLLLATACYFGDYSISGRIAAIIAFIVLTAPVAAHMIGRAAYFSNVPLWKGTVCDELRDRYDIKEHILHDPAEIEEPGQGH